MLKNHHPPAFKVQFQQELPSISVITQLTVTSNWKVFVVDGPSMQLGCIPSYIGGNNPCWAKDATGVEADLMN